MRRKRVRWGSAGAVPSLKEREIGERVWQQGDRRHGVDARHSSSCPAYLGMKPYNAMKDSGVEWLGDVPEHWQVRQLGRMGRMFKGNGGTKADETDEGIPCVRYGDLYTNHSFHITETRSCVDPRVAERAYTSIEYGDVLFAGSGETIEEIGKSAVNLMRGPACCGGDVIVFRPSIAMNAAFLGYATDCPPAALHKARMGRGFTVMHIYGTDLKRLNIAVPPVVEQTAIARFLDHATSRIDRYIRAKQKLIELLEEQRQATINEAVSGQIDVETGRPYPSHRVSDIGWLQRVPSHWETRRSKRVFRPRLELARPNDVQLSATQAWGVIAQTDFEERVGRKVVRISQHLDKRRHVEIDDFVISMRSFQGGLERAWTRGCIRSSYIVLRATTGISCDFFGFLFKSSGYINALRSTADFIRDGQDLNFDNFCRVDLPFPPLDEQWRIGRALNKRLRAFSSAIEKSRREMALLTEFRQRLVADVATGKLDVRDVAARLPNEPDDPGTFGSDHSLAKAGKDRRTPGGNGTYHREEAIQ